jgi:serine-protein kinase ATM
MEQVFEQVTKLLKSHNVTRQRNLHIRTYKVVPLSSTSGIMEFVRDTIPFASYVMPAHQKYYPKDWSNGKCRNAIGQVSNQSIEDRCRTYQQVAENFHPVLRFFFLERYKDPDEWFEKRLAYTRTTAAISILGHIIGLGDRHCHNILLDERNGEVVHIDLGVAFEAGRVLPIPEVVPFRLTRDVVDAMGCTKTEGVFRRCCEFTLEALREERDAIMTLLNVLRYDPLHSWKMSPARAKRIQEEQQGPQAGVPADGGEAVVVQESVKRKADEGDEAGRALGMVEKKLAKTLSTTATVNALIQQATDERNLAVLFCGKFWSHDPLKSELT